MKVLTIRLRRKANVKTADNALMATSEKDITIQGFSSFDTLSKIDPKLNAEDKANHKETHKNIESKTDSEDIGEDTDADERMKKGFSLTHLEEIIRPAIDKEFKRVKQISNNFARVNNYKKKKQ